MQSTNIYANFHHNVFIPIISYKFTDANKSITDHSLSRILQIPSPDNGETQYGPEIACGRPFCKLKRKHHFHCHLCNQVITQKMQCNNFAKLINLIPQAFSELEKLRPHVLKHSNVSPLKAPDSDHSTDEDSLKNEHEDNQDLSKDGKSSSSQPRGVSEGSPHNQLPDPFPKFDLGLHASNPFPPTSLSNFLYPGAPSPYLFLQQNQLSSLYAGMMFAGGSVPGSVFSHGGGGILPQSSMVVNSNPPNHPHLGSGPGTPPSSIMLPNLPSLAESPTTPMQHALMSGSSPCQLQQISNQNLKRPPSGSGASPLSPASPSEAKKARMQMRILKDEPVPEGYIRFRFNEDCAYVHCGYRGKVNH